MMQEISLKIGFVGLGRMGAGMAGNLLKSGADLVVYDKYPAAIAPLVAQGATAAQNLAEMAARVDVIFTSLPGPVEVEEAVFAADGILAHMRPGLALFDLSTNARDTVLKVHDAVVAKGGVMFDAPVSGGPAGAASGELVLWVGGEPAAFERYLPILKRFSSSQQRVGGIGAGTVTKLAHNMLGYTLMEALSEAFTLAVKAGIDPLDFWQALGAGMVGRKPVTHMLINQFLPGIYDQPAFLQKLALKDITLATQLAAELDVPVRLAELTRQDMHATVHERGMGEWDSRAFLQMQLQRAGVSIQVDGEALKTAVSAAS